MPTLPYSQAAENNKAPILAVLQDVLREPAEVLEIGSGTGQHAVWFGRNLPHVVWQPSERPENLPGLRQRLAAEAPANVRRSVALDVADQRWPVRAVDAVFAANVVHIMSWRHVEMLFARLAEVLRPGGFLVLYGAYKYGGKFTTESNEDFDLWLRSRDLLSGIRDFEAVDALARAIGLELLADHPMPSNNQCLVWRRTGTGEAD